MKIALLLTGQLRTNKLCRHLIKNILIDKYDTDIFMAIDANNMLQCEHKNSKNTTNQTDISDAITFFNPINHFISYDYTDEFNNILLKFDRANIGKYTNPLFLKIICQQYYIVDKAYKMLQTHIDTTGAKYDLIIRLRFDQYIWSDSISDMLTKLIRIPNTNNIIYNNENIELIKAITKDLTIELDTDIPNQVNVFGYGPFHNYYYVNDQFFTHGQHLISTVSKFYEEMVPIINKCAITTYPNNGACIEYFWYIFLTNHNITIAKTKNNGIFVREFY